MQPIAGNKLILSKNSNSLLVEGYRKNKLYLSEVNKRGPELKVRLETCPEGTVRYAKSYHLTDYEHCSKKVLKF